jgi:glycosyltransferase involved in cell wall biosynthesis
VKASPDFNAVRIIHCAETIKGGIATYLRELIRLQALSFSPQAVLVVIPETQVQELPVPAGVQVLTYPVMARRSWSAAQLAWKVAMVAKRFQPSIVHVHSSFAGAAVRPALGLMGMADRIVYCPHGWAFDRQMSPWARQLATVIERTMARFCAQIVCVSEHERRSALAAGLPAGKLQLVLNGIATHAPAPEGLDPQWPEGALRLLFVGRFDPQKGADIFCQALAQLGSGVHAILAGGNVVSGLQGQLKLPDNATSIGWVNHAQLEVLLRSADVLVMPSRWEGFGLTAAEAMRAGLAVLASRVGGLPEVVREGETGLLFDPGRIDELVHILASTPIDRWKTMGTAGRQRFASSFTMERVHQEILQVYLKTSGLSHTVQPN